MSVATGQLVAIHTKDPTEKLNYRFDWLDEYFSGDVIDPNDTINTSVWTSTPSGLTHVATSITGSNTETNIRISGGLDGQDYVVTNHCVLVSTQEVERSFLLKVRDR